VFDLAIAPKNKHKQPTSKLLTFVPRIEIVSFVKKGVNEKIISKFKLLKVLNKKPKPNKKKISAILFTITALIAAFNANCLVYQKLIKK
jgi:hypothetical protein